MQIISLLNGKVMQALCMLACKLQLFRINITPVGIRTIVAVIKASALHWKNLVSIPLSKNQARN